jgi:hypothetical protein
MSRYGLVIRKRILSARGRVGVESLTESLMDDDKSP